MIPLSNFVKNSYLFDSFVIELVALYQCYQCRYFGAIALSYPPRVRATVKLSAAFFHDESSITNGVYESAIAP